VPTHLPPEGEPIAFEYKLHWMLDPAGRPPAGYVSSTRQGSVLMHPGQRRFVVEFTGAQLNKMTDSPDMEAVISIGEGAKMAGRPVIQKNRFTGVWRANFEVEPDGSGRAVEMRCFLRKQQHVLTETWSYLWIP